MVSTNKRKEKDVMKLLVSDYDVQIVNEQSNSEFLVKFYGPKDSPYEGVSVMTSNLTIKFWIYMLHQEGAFVTTD